MSLLVDWLVDWQADQFVVDQVEVDLVEVDQVEVDLVEVDLVEVDLVDHRIHRFALLSCPDG